MPGHRPSGSVTGLMIDHDDHPRPEPSSSNNESTDGSPTIWKGSSNSLPAFMAEKQHQQQQQQQQRSSWRRHRTVSLCVFVSSLVCFCVLALALGLGLGLGFRSRHRAGDNSTAAHTPPFNYSSYYGIPADLGSVPAERLVNATELELDTGFAAAEAEKEGSGSPAVRDYVFDVTQAWSAPDGFRKPMVLVNGQSPGPLVEANTGDTVRVRVNNRMADWSTAIHWHGIDQRGSPWMDGVAGVSQCGIPPGRSFTYEFRVAGQRGTFWWHAHLSVQYSDGAYGPIVRLSLPFLPFFFSSLSSSSVFSVHVSCLVTRGVEITCVTYR